MISRPPAGLDRQSGLVLEIPSLMVSLPIVGVPYSGAGWDTSWLADQAGYLAGSAYPTHAGNTVITAHVWDAYNRPGPFWQLSELSFGEEIRIYGWGKVFRYQVQANLRVGPNQTGKVFQEQDRDVISLLTCENWNPEEVSYSNRRLVRAVLIEVSNDPE